MSGLLTPTQTAFLRLLTRTGFATNKHLEQMNINRLKNSTFGTGRKVMYYITKKGAQFVSDTDGTPIEELAYTHYSGGIKKAHIDGETALVRSDFAHKERYITTFLALEQYLEQTDYLIDRFYHYYQLKGDKGTTLSVNGKNFRPDGIFFCESVIPDKPLFTYTVMRSVIKELQTFEEWTYIKSFFMFARLEDLMQDFYKGCAYFGGDKKPLPPRK